ncbi:MAG: hypothetical protein ACOYON_12635 [Fimbriimonas sp.]
MHWHPFRAPDPHERKLRIFAFDPAVAYDLDTSDLGQVTISVPWEKLKPGPVGEYIEVVDVDPQANAIYQPVDLDDPRLLATEGLAPSEGNPMFHQQMVYASAMHTIQLFENALGRGAVWQSRMATSKKAIDFWSTTHKDGDKTILYRTLSDAKKEKVELEHGYVRRLRIYPHAFRQKNAYYDPSRRALLFGYFAAPSKKSERYLPGGMVFTCLSHDVVSHEVTHALLDGMYPKLVMPTNDDMLAFHEGFADIVAIFSHFTIPGVVRSEIARNRGNLGKDGTLLGNLAMQFGLATGKERALRSATGETNVDSMDTTLEPHARGNLLAKAVYLAFNYIFERRTADLRRIASNGSGILAEGELSPDLVSRLADEAVTSARHVLTMCVRALDYVTPQDLTFGDYLRGLITADMDIVPNDTGHYRMAFIQAFRESGIYPNSVSGLGEDSVRWRTDSTRRIKWTEEAAGIIIRNGGNVTANNLDRFEAYYRVGLLQAELHDSLVEKAEKEDLAWMGINHEIKQKNGKVNVAITFAQALVRVGPDGQQLRQFIMRLEQKALVPLASASIGAALKNGEVVHPSEAPELAKSPGYVTVRGGSTLIFSLDTGDLRFAIRKNIINEDRWAVRREWELARRRGRKNTTGVAITNQPFAFLHHDRYQR